MDLTGRTVAYIYNENLVLECDKLPNMLNRATIVQDLIISYGLLSKSNVTVVKSRDASEDELKLFHSSGYIEFLKLVNSRDNLEEFNEEQEGYGLVYDCPLLKNNYDFVRSVAGGSISAAKILNSRKYKYAINWFGGWHHARRDSSEGFCYVNDIVLAIQILTKGFQRILYIDLDIHHGDGVQSAFELSNKILTFSLHKMALGFYPGTGHLEEVGSSKGKYYSINVPLRQGINDKHYTELFHSIFPKICEKFHPDVIVVQCGADSLNGDPVGESNLTLLGIGQCIHHILTYDVPTLFLGGGGYNFPNTARLWTYLTSIILGCELDNDIPDCSEFYTDYVPSYELHIDPGNQKDHNDEDYIRDISNRIHSNCENIQ